MFQLDEKIKVIRNILKSDYMQYSPTEISTKNTANSQKNFKIPRKDSVISLLNSYIDLVFDA